MAEELTVEEKCATWAGALALFGETIEKLAKKIVLTPEEKEEMRTVIKHIDVAVRSVKENCMIIVERK